MMPFMVNGDSSCRPRLGLGRRERKATEKEWVGRKDGARSIRWKGDEKENGWKKIVDGKIKRSRREEELLSMGRTKGRRSGAVFLR
jgi:hypothetical protein